MTIIFTQHSKEVLKLRSIPQQFIEKCILNPDITVPGKNNKTIFLKNMGKNFIKVIAARENTNIIVITAYWIEKERIKG